MNQPSSPDANVEAIRTMLLIRSQVGLNKYGVTTERPDLTTLQWLRHAQEEALDTAVYLQRLITDIEKGNAFYGVAERIKSVEP